NLAAASPYNNFLPMYYPRNNQTATDLVDVNSRGCSDYDQRLLNRNKELSLQLNHEFENTCQISSVQQMNLAAVHIADIKNSSLVTQLDYYHINIDQLKEIIADETTDQDNIEDFKDELAKFENLLKYTKQYQKYRATYLDPFVLAVAGEE